MPKLSISCNQWLEAASYGNIDQLRAWHKNGQLEIRYDPVQVGVSGKQGRAKIFDVCSPDKENALMKAVAFGQGEYALELLRLGQFADSANIKGKTAVHMAAQSGLMSVLEALIDKGHALDRIDKSGATPLWDAVDRDREGAVRFLLSKGANPQKPDALDCLDKAVGKQRPSLVLLLLSHGADPNKPGEWNETPLHVMAALWERGADDPENAWYVITRALMQAGADPEKIMDRHGERSDVYSLFRGLDAEKGKSLVQQWAADYRASCLAQATEPAAFSSSRLRL